MRTHHGAEPPPSQAERSWAREVRQLSDELQDAERGRPRLLEIAARKLSENVSDGDRDRLIDEFITRVEPSGASAGGVG